MSPTPPAVGTAQHAGTLRRAWRYLYRLPLLAWREYGDATAWRSIAEANGIDDPMVLVPGTELIVPGLDESARGEYA